MPEMIISQRRYEIPVPERVNPHYFRLMLRDGDKVMPDTLYLEGNQTFTYCVLTKPGDAPAKIAFEAILVGFDTKFNVPSTFDLNGPVRSYPNADIIGFLFTSRTPVSKPITDDTEGI